MKLISTILISLAVFFAMNHIIPTNEEYEIYESTVRLHVLANSDSEEDQSAKLLVRDALLEQISAYEAQSREEAIEMIEKNEEELCALAVSVLEQEGMSHQVRIEVGRERYPTRYYEDFALPAGIYTSVRVIIGEGEGQNWWCVLYPPLCTASAVAYDEDYCLEVGLTKGQYNLITENEKGEYKIKFRILEIASEVFGFEY